MERGPMPRNAEATLKFFNSNAPTLLKSAQKLDEVSRETEGQTFGQYLRRERILRGITKEEVLRITKVQAEYYEALESNRFDLLPPRAFVVGFLKVFADYAGLDKDEVVTRFLAQYPTKVKEEVDEFEQVGFVRKHAGKVFAFIGFASLIFLMFAPLLRG